MRRRKDIQPLSPIRYRSPMPEGRLPWYFVHDPATEARQGLALAGTLVTPIARTSGRSLSPAEREEVDIVADRLAADRRAGRPVGPAAWISGDGLVTPQALPAHSWLRRRLADYHTVRVQVPQGGGAAARTGFR